LLEIVAFPGLKGETWGTHICGWDGTPGF